MKPSSFVFAAVCLAIAFVSCTKSSGKKIYKGRIINSVCGNTTVQYLGSVGRCQNGWVLETGSGRTVYDHVFRVANPCDAGVGSKVAGDTINFEVLVATPVQNCMECMAICPTPDTLVAISIK